MKKCTAILLLCAMLLSFAACGESTETTQETQTPVTETEAVTETETEETRAQHAVPEKDFNGANHHSVYLNWSAFAFYFFADESTGEVMNDAIYERTTFVEEYLNVDLTHMPLDQIADVNNTVKNAVAAGDDEYSAAFIHCIDGVSALPTGGYLYDLESLPVIDMDAEWWNREQMDTLRLGKKTYYAVSDYIIPTPYVIFFNEDIVTDNGLESPYELVYEGKWTLDAFVDMALVATQDLNGDGEITPDDDQFGLTTDETSKYTSFMTGAGQFLTERGEDGKIKLAFNTERTIGIVEKLYKLTEIPGALSRADKFACSDTTFMNTGKALFYMASLPNAEIFRDSDVSIGILPYPKYDETQSNYITQDWGGFMCVPSTISDPEMVGSVMELLAWDSKNNVVPTYFDVTLSGKLSRNEDTKNMLDIIFDTLAYEIGGNYFGFSGGFQNLYYTLASLVAEGKSKDFASFYAKYEKGANAAIEKFYKDIEAIEN